MEAGEISNLLEIVEGSLRVNKGAGKQRAFSKQLSKCQRNPVSSQAEL